MTQAINLMPNNYRQKLGDHRVRRRFFIHTAMALLLIIGIAAQQKYVISVRRSQEAQLLEHVNSLRKARETLANLEKKADEGIQTIAEYQHTALPIKISSVIGTASDLVPNEVSVDAMRVWVQETQVAKSTVARMQEHARVARSGQKVKTETRRTLMTELTGVAENDLGISVLLENLERHPLFQHIQLDYSKGAILNGTEVREFRVLFEVDLENRYLPQSARPEQQENKA